VNAIARSRPPYAVPSASMWSTSRSFVPQSTSTCGFGRQRGQSFGEFRHGAHAAATAHDQHERAVEREPEPRAGHFAPLHDREARVHRNAGDLDALARHAVPGQLLGGLVAAHEVAVHVRVGPQRMRRVVGDHHVQRHVEPAATADRVERLDGQEVRAHDGIRSLALDDSHEPRSASRSSASRAGPALRLTRCCPHSE
jgi:hypothetical protein